MGCVWRIAAGMTDRRLAVIALASFAAAVALIGLLFGFSVAAIIAEAAALLASVATLAASVYVLLYRSDGA